MTRGRLRGFCEPGARDQREPLNWDFTLERVTGIEPALSAWETNRSVPLTTLTWDPNAPRVTLMDPMTPGLMARQWPVAWGNGLVRTGQPRVLHEACGQLACCDACQPDCDRGRPNTKYEIGTTPAEFTTATSGARTHLGPPDLACWPTLDVDESRHLRMPSATASVMISLRVLSWSSLRPLPSEHV